MDWRPSIDRALQTWHRLPPAWRTRGSEHTKLSRDYEARLPEIPEALAIALDGFPLVRPPREDEPPHSRYQRLTSPWLTVTEPLFSEFLARDDLRVEALLMFLQRQEFPSNARSDSERQVTAEGLLHAWVRSLYRTALLDVPVPIGFARCPIPKASEDAVLRAFDNASTLLPDNLQANWLQVLGPKYGLDILPSLRKLWHQSNRGPLVTEAFDEVFVPDGLAQIMAPDGR